MKKLLTTLLFLSSLVQSATITGIGYADIEKEAKKESLADLSNKISVDVKSDFKTITKALGDDYQKLNEKLIELSSNLPLKGIEFKTLVGNRLVKTTAILSTKKALILYISELKRLHKNISASMLEYETAKNDDAKYNILNQVLKDIQSFNKHKTVAILLGGKNLPILNTTQSEILSKLQRFIQTAPTIKIASKILTKDITKSHIYISAIKPSGSNEVTQFAKILKDNMAQNLNIVKYSNGAKYFLRGSYEILKDSIFITVNLMDTKNNILKTNTITLSYQAYKNLSYKPTTKTFDKAMNSGFVKSGKLYVNIGFKGYERENGIDLKAGDTVDIVVKTNKPICYYLVGYTLKSKEKFAYLLPIGSDNSPFINYLTGDDVNKNITIANNVPVEAPFGSETLQIFSSTLNKDGSCPLITPKCEDNEDDYCVLNGTPSKVITKTRGLNLRHRRFEIEKAEGSISWSSFGK